MTMSEEHAPQIIECATERPNGFPQQVTVRHHSFRADVGPASGGTDSAPGAHDYFDAALAACKAHTATWFARQKGIALERIDVRVERDDREERRGTYGLRVRLAFHGPLSDEDRARLYAAVAHCPIHKLMTTSDVVIETAPLDPGDGRP
jgi:putative redox protein